MQDANFRILWKKRIVRCKLNYAFMRKVRIARCKLRILQQKSQRTVRCTVNPSCEFITWIVRYKLRIWRKKVFWRNDLFNIFISWWNYASIVIRQCCEWCKTLKSSRIKSKTTHISCLNESRSFPLSKSCCIKHVLSYSCSTHSSKWRQ